MTAAAERRLLQLAILLASAIPILFGALGVLRGARWMLHATPPADLDSHFRYLSGLFLMLGVAFLFAAARIEARTRLFRLLGAMVIVGGLARALSLAEVGPPAAGHRLGLVMELVIVPLLLLWQTRVAARFTAPDAVPDRP